MWKVFLTKKLLRYTWEYTLGRSHTYCRSRTSILSFTWGNTQKRDHVNAAFVTRFSCRTSILSITWGKHTRERSCNCRKAFSQKYHLGIHLRIHTATREKPHICNICDQLFCRSRTASSNSTWENTQGRNHANVAIVKNKIDLRVHSGEKSYLCSYYNFFFLEKQF